MAVILTKVKVTVSTGHGGCPREIDMWATLDDSGGYTLCSSPFINDGLVTPANPFPVKPVPVTLVPLDAATTGAANQAVVALLPSHRTGGGFIQNPEDATENLGINEITVAAGTASRGSTTFIVPGQYYRLQPSALGVSVIAADDNHPFSGMGIQ